MKRPLRKMAIAIVNVIAIITSLFTGFGSLLLLDVAIQRLNLSWNLPWQIEMVLSYLWIILIGGFTAFILSIARDYLFDE